MKLKELKCKNCGATIKVEENIEKAKCEFCHSTFVIEDAYHDGYKFEKGRMKAHSEQFEKTMESAKDIIVPIGKVFAAQYIISAVVGFIIFLLVIIGVIVLVVTQVNDNKEQKDDTEMIINDMYNEISKGSEIIRNNSTFEMYSGARYGYSVSDLIDKISAYNEKDKNHQIAVEYNDDLEIDLDELQDQISNITKYDISFEYDEDGSISTVKIKEYKQK